MTSPLLFQELLQKMEAHWKGVPDKPDENPISTLCALWNFVTGTQPAATDDIMQLHPLDLETAEKLIKLVDKRLSGTPLAYLIGYQTFMDLDFLVSPAAMIPRKETELLGNIALKIARNLVEERGGVHGLDLCTGSGNIVLALAYLVPEYQGLAVDISGGAVRLATRNAEKFGVGERVRFLEGDLFSPFDDPKCHHIFDLITCNPPYIATSNTETMPAEISKYEPREAFNGGPYGVNLIMRMMREAPLYLKPASWLVFEVGLGQGKSVQNMLEKTRKYQYIGTCKDEAGHIRVLAAQTL